MDNPAFQNDNGVGVSRHPKKMLTRANSTLTPTNKSWHLTQAPRSKLCRCNSVLVSPQDCCVEESEHSPEVPASIDYPFFGKRSPTKNILSDGTLWTKEFLTDSFSRLHDSSLAFHKFPSSIPGVSTIYDPQFLSSKFGYSGSHHSMGNNEMKKEWWPGRWPWGWGWRWEAVDHNGLPGNHKVAALLCTLLLMLLVSFNVVYILRTVEKPAVNSNRGAWVDIVLISGEFRITNEPYRPALANQSSEDFQQLSSLVSQQLDSLFSLSVLSEPYHSTAVTELLPGLVVRSQSVLRATGQLTASKVGLAFIGGLRNQHGHVWLGNFSVDIQSIGFQASGDAVSWTGWSQWGECEHTQEFGYVQVRSRNCTLRSGLYLYSTLPCLLVPHSHGNVETSPCMPPQESPLMDSAESNLNLVTSRIANNSSLSERIVGVVKITREDCNKNKTVQEIPLIHLNSSATEVPVTNESLPCSCTRGQVCVALQEEEPPQCLSVLDTTDPTGCGGHCKINTQLCQKIQENAFRCVDDTGCFDNEWQCGNKLCIPLSKRCDGHFNCYDHTDEHDCDCNLTSHFQCGNRMSCLSLAKRCDAVVDCWDATDELNCTIHCLGVDQFTCNDSQCIPNHRFCDGFPDCKDHSDEPFGCGGECKTHEWRCSNSRCVPQSKQCDGTDDCGDSSDEADCPTVTPE